MKHLKIILGSSVRTKEWEELQKCNAFLFDDSIILTDGFESDFYNYKRTKENYFMASTCRNLVIEEFLKTDGDYLVWLDEDCKIDKENYDLLLETIKEKPNDIIIGERTYKSKMKDIRVKKDKFNNYVGFRYAYTCFIVYPREVLESQREWFSEYFNGCWGFEDTAFGFKCELLGYKFFVTDAKVEVQGEETYIEADYDNYNYRIWDESKRRQYLHNQHKFNGYWKYLDKQHKNK